MTAAFNSTSRKVTQEPWIHVIWLMGISLAVIVIYGKVTGAYFCASDDFIEIHRAAFEDTREPSRIFTTSHFNSYKYRPVNRAITLVTYSVGQDDSTVFRSRNLAFHLLNVVLMYAVGWLLFRTYAVSGMGSLLFGLHPLANQTIIGAVWANTIAHAGFLLALVLFVISVHYRRSWSLWLIGALITAWLSLLTYDTSITVFGLMGVYLAVQLLRQREVIRWRFIILFGSAVGTLLGIYVLLRRVFVPRGWEQATAYLPSLVIAIKNLAMYFAALLSPLDTVLANQWLHTPLPSEMAMNDPTVLLFGGSALFVASTLWIALWQARRNRQEIDWAAVVFLVTGILFPLLPVLALQSRPSETYLYLPVAFYGLLVSYIMVGVLPGKFGRKGLNTSLSALLVVGAAFAAATWIRNGRVYECGETARQILSSVPGIKEGSWKLSFANVVGEEATHRYGFYGFRGVDVIGGGRSGEEAMTRALQLVHKNEALAGEVVEPQKLVDKCRQTPSPHHICVWVHSDGRVERHWN